MDGHDAADANGEDARGDGAGDDDGDGVAAGGGMDALSALLSVASSHGVPKQRGSGYKRQPMFKAPFMRGSSYAVRGLDAGSLK